MKKWVASFHLKDNLGSIGSSAFKENCIEAQTIEQAAEIFKVIHSDFVVNEMGFTLDEIDTIFITGYDFDGDGHIEVGTFKYSTLEKIP